MSTAESQDTTPMDVIEIETSSQDSEPSASQAINITDESSNDGKNEACDVSDKKTEDHQKDLEVSETIAQTVVFFKEGLKKSVESKQKIKAQEKPDIGGNDSGTLTESEGEDDDKFKVEKFGEYHLLATKGEHDNLEQAIFFFVATETTLQPHKPTLVTMDTAIIMPRLKHHVQFFATNELMRKGIWTNVVFDATFMSDGPLQIIMLNKSTTPYTLKAGERAVQAIVITSQQGHVSVVSDEDFNTCAEGLKTAMKKKQERQARKQPKDGLSTAKGAHYQTFVFTNVRHPHMTDVGYDFASITEVTIPPHQGCDIMLRGRIMIRRADAMVDLKPRSSIFKRGLTCDSSHIVGPCIKNSVQVHMWNNTTEAVTIKAEEYIVQAMPMGIRRGTAGVVSQEAFDKGVDFMVKNYPFKRGHDGMGSSNNSQPKKVAMMFTDEAKQDSTLPNPDEKKVAKMITNKPVDADKQQGSTTSKPKAKLLRL